MKKTIMVFMLAGLAACASHNNSECRRPDYSQPVVYETEEEFQFSTAPCACAAATYEAEYNPCNCSYQPDPCREVLRPRVKEVVAEKPRRNCPPDGQMINCGCGNCPTFSQPTAYQQANGAQVAFVASDAQYVTENYIPAKEIIPNQPDAYLLASGRVLNHFFKDTLPIYSRSPDVKLFVKNANVGSNDLPGGINSGPDNMKKQIAGSYTFALSDTLADADYYLETDVDWLDTPSKTVPAIQYKVALYDVAGNKINEWVEVIKRADNSQNWL